MGGKDLDVLYRELKQQLREQRDRLGLGQEDLREQLAADVQKLQADYPGFNFGVIARPGAGETAIEATPGEDYEGSLISLIQPGAEGIRTGLAAEGVYPASKDDAAALTDTRGCP